LLHMLKNNTKPGKKKKSEESRANLAKNCAIKKNKEGEAGFKSVGNGGPANKKSGGKKPEDM